MPIVGHSDRQGDEKVSKMRESPAQILLREDTSDGLCILTINRPEKLNSLNTAIFERLEAEIGEIEKADHVGCVVIRGAGKNFSAGHDLQDIGEGESVDHLRFQGLVVERLANLPQPVIAAVRGHCYTGALELALAADLIIACETAKFADTHARWGLTPVWGMSQRLPRRVGVAKARELMFTCRTVSGREALSIDLANRCFEENAFEAGIDEVAQAILRNSWFSNAANKRLTIETDGLRLADGLSHELHRNAGTAPDMAARIEQFSKRKA